MRNKEISPKVKTILELLSKGVLLSSLFIFPGAGIGIGAIYDVYEELKREKELKEWQKFNLPRLRYILKRLKRQKLIEITEEKNHSVVRLTERGKLRILKYNFEEMTIEKPPHWDKKWRLVMYDIRKFKRREQETLRRILNRLKFLLLQKSVYLTPYPCENEITFLREYFGVSDAVLYIRADKIENEKVYRDYFGI